MNELTIGWMYPNLLNLHGECGSVQALAHIGGQMGLSINIQRIEDFDDPIAFEDLDLLIFLPGEISIFPHLMEGLQKQKQELDDYIQSGHYVLALGTTGLMFGRSILREDGSTMNCLGYLDMTARERKYVWGDDLHFRAEGVSHEIAGSQIQMADVEAAHPLGSTIYGMGNNRSGSEGARFENLLYTNCLGPLFVKNPWFGQDILKATAEAKGLQYTEITEFPLAEGSFQATLEFIENKPKK